jgi:uncharacterized short protein YbdD (DUF466 family)
MRAKFIYEKFKKESDPIKDMNVGIKDYEDYIQKILKNEGYDVDEYWEWFNDTILDMNRPSDLLEMLMEVMKHTPLEYQIEWAHDSLEEWRQYKKEE